MNADTKSLDLVAFLIINYIVHREPLSYHPIFELTVLFHTENKKKHF